MPLHAAVALIALLAVLLIMLGELLLSRYNEHVLLERGAYRVDDEVYRTMQWAYPGVFVAMALEGAVFGPEPGATTLAGVLLLIGAKVLKFWAIASLGTRWTYRVLVLPDAPLVQHGAYRIMRHPNYIAVVGELVGVALITGARVTGPIAVLFFGSLLRRRILAEEHALGIARRH